MKIVLLSVMLFAVSMVVSCGGWNVGKAKSSVHFKPELVKDEKDVILYFYCFEGEQGSKMPMNIILDDNKVAEVIIGGYSFVHTTPGKHTVVFERPALLRFNEKAEFNVEANDVVLFRIGKKIQTISAQQGFYEISELREQRFSQYHK